MITGLEQLAARLKGLPPGAVLTGSGVSAESGISTYRDKGGLWDTHPKGASGGMLGVLAAYPDQASRILGDFFSSLKRALPNPGHIALAGMEKAGIIKGVITQNVDDLHNRAGNRVVYELHGNVMRLRCMSCGKREKPHRDEFFQVAERLSAKASETGLSALLNELPRCLSCHGIMRPDFVSFGEAVQDLFEAVTLAENCGFMLVCGTSGMVHPAASLPARARERGAFIVEINPGESALTHMADAVIRENSARALPKLLELLTG